MTEDATFGGYLRKHERAPAFGGSDGYAYSVGVYTNAEPDGVEPVGAALVFVRWSEQGDQPIGHLESEYLAYASSEKEARKRLHDLSLQDVKQALERAIMAQAETEPPSVGDVE